MQSIRTHRQIILLPLLLLAVFLSLFVYTEYSKHETNSEIRKVVNDRMASKVNEWQASVSELESNVDLYFVGTSKPIDKNKEIIEGFETVRDYEIVISGLLVNEINFGHENLVQVDMLRTVRADLIDIEKLLPVGGENIANTTWEDLRSKVDVLIRNVRSFSLSIEDGHREEVNHLLSVIDDYEESRVFLAVFVMFCGLMLIFSLLDSMCRYRKNAEKAMAAERYNDIFRVALKSTRVGVLIRDMQVEGTPVIFVNEAFSRMTGYVIEDIPSSSSEFLFGWKTEPKTIAAFRRSISLQETSTFDVLIYRKEGAPFWSEWHLSPLLDENGRLTHFVSLFTDTTAIRETQEELIHAKQLAQHASTVKTNFLAMMSHEIRTPINGILGVLKLVEETKLNDEQKHLVDIAKTSSHALHGIINDILDYAKMEAGKVELFNEVFSLPRLLDSILGLFQTLVKEKGIELGLTIQGDLTEYFVGDDGRIRQILLNLLSNAIKFTDKGFVRLYVLPLMEQEVDGKKGLLLRFEVQDTGMGISAEDQEKLFKEFSQIERSFTRRFGGTGLGLAISRRLVSLFKGEIGVESQPGKGSRFWFMIPLQVAQASDVQELKTQQNETVPLSRTAHQRHILLVEDNDTNRLVARRYLEKEFFIVEEAINGLDAIEKAKAADFDLILMDVSMPEMDGMLATCHIRALGGHNARVPVIALTAHVMAGDRELCLAAGMNDYLHKPIEPEALKRSLARWLHVRSSFDDEEKAVTKNEVKAIVQEIPAMPIFDPRVLERMKEDLGGDAVDQVTKVFLQDSENRIKDFDTTDIEVIMNTAHTLKSCSANCGLMRFSYLMADLERAAHKRENDKVEQLMKEVGLTYKVARDTLVSEREKYSS